MITRGSALRRAVAIAGIVAFPDVLSRTKPDLAAGARATTVVTSPPEGRKVMTVRYTGRADSPGTEPCAPRYGCGDIIYDKKTDEAFVVTAVGWDYMYLLPIPSHNDYYKKL